MLLADWVSRTEQGLMLLKALKALSHAAVSVSQYNQINPILRSTETEFRHGRHICYILLNSVKSYCASICRVCRWGTSISSKIGTGDNGMPGPAGQDDTPHKLSSSILLPLLGDHTQTQDHLGETADRAYLYPLCQL